MLHVAWGLHNQATTRLFYHHFEATDDDIDDSGASSMFSFILLLRWSVCVASSLNHGSDDDINCPGAGIIEADDCQVTTVFTVQPSFHHWHSTNRVS